MAEPLGRVGDVGVPAFLNWDDGVTADEVKPVVDRGANTAETSVKTVRTWVAANS